MNLTPTTFDDIIELLKACDDAYFNTDDTLISDREYDLLKRRAFAMDRSDSYFLKIGSSVRGGKIPLPYPMGSLTQIYEGELEGWIKKYNLNYEGITITHKLDGTSCLLVYNNGKLSIAYSRGDGLQGADITRHIKMIPSVPQTIDPIYDYMVVRAEVIMKNTTFTSKYSYKKNARGFVSGAMNRKETEEDVLKDIEVIAYEVVAFNEKNVRGNVTDKLDMLQLLRTQKFLTVDYQTSFGRYLNDQYLTDKLAIAKQDSPYELDGLVVTISNSDNLELQSKSSSLNPEHSIKFKINDSEAVLTTSVVDVHWELSKNGLWKPKIQVIPVNIYSSTVTYASGYNAKYICDNKIGHGAKITITKSGQVIPMVVSVISPAPNFEQNFTDSINKIAGGNWSWNENGVEIFQLDYQNDPRVIFKQVLDFYETFKVDMLRESTLEKVWNYLPSKQYDDAVCDIFDLTLSEWTKIVGANGAKIHKSLHDRLDNTLPEIFLGASKYMGTGFGVRKAKALSNGESSIDTIWTLTEAQIIDKEGFSNKTAEMVLAGLPQTKALLERLNNIGGLNFMKENKTSEMSEVVLVMSGFRDAILSTTVENMGGKVTSSVSKKTTHLLLSDPSSTSGKAQKARELGVKVMSPDEFKLEYGI